MNPASARLIYLDNAATSWPKPDCVADAMLRFLRDIGANPGRSGHRLANEAERVRFTAREYIAKLLGLSDPLRILFMPNATTGLNLVLRGLLRPGDHVVATGMEHNAVMRPLRTLERAGVWLTIAHAQPDGTVDPQEIENAIRPRTRLVVVNHASNVCGTVLDLAAIANRTRAHNIPLLVDAAQTAGCWPIHIEHEQIDLLAFTGHKSLLGPAGTGGLAIHPHFDVDQLPPLIAGGTGSRSEHEYQPHFLPDKYEAGTTNNAGLAGLAAGVEYVLNRSIDSIRQHEANLTQHLIDGLRAIAGINVLGSHDAARQTPTVSFTLANRTPSEIAQRLDEEFGILCRPGLHCAPRAHSSLGTLPDGTVRLAAGLFTTAEQIDTTLAATQTIAETA